jgi:pyruvate-formate lyase-activating enzyme
MNGKLIENSNNAHPSLMERLKEDVIKIKPSMIFISGGEPTVNPLSLFVAIRTFKSWGCKVGVSTNGINTNVLNDFILKYHKIDYVAMYLKGNIDAYKALGSTEYYMNVMASWLILRKEKKDREEFNYEIRTTLFKPFVNKSVLKDIGRYMGTDEKWVLQQFRIVSGMPSEKAKKIKPYSEEELNSLLIIAQKFCKNTSIRYV